MTELSGRICPGCNETVGITIADESYTLLCGGNCPPHRYNYDGDDCCDDKGHGWTTAHLRCEDTGLAAMRVEQN